MKSKQIERKPEIGTFGSAEQYPTLPCIVDYLNNKMDNTERRRFIRFLTRMIETVKRCNEIPNLDFKIKTKLLYEKIFRDQIDPFCNFNPEYETLRTHLHNFTHAKFSRNEDVELQYEQQKNKQLEQQRNSWIKDIKVLPFNIFGSKSSIDLDVVVYFDHIDGSIQDHSHTCHKYTIVVDHYLKTFENYIPKKINLNIAEVKDGRIIKVHKGTPDEVNNSVVATYDLHQQYFACPVTQRYDRIGHDNFYTHLKAKRCLRFLISFFSRVPMLRNVIKPAMKGNVNERLVAVQLINFVKYTSFEGKKDKVEDIYKVIGFQIIQTLGLINGIEIFTKEDAVQYIPELHNFLMRKEISEQDLKTLQLKLSSLIFQIQELIPRMTSLNEEIL